MLRKIWKYLEDKERAWRYSFGNDLLTPAARRQARRHFNWVDHGILRVYWTNFAPVAEGVFRSNQPSPERLRRYRDKGIRSVLNLRGTSPLSQYLLEKEACNELGLKLTDIHLSATQLPTLDTIHELERHFRTLQKPFVMHCKSGADRAGFASALYQLLIEDMPIEIAQKQLSLRFLHLKSSSKGILDYCLEKYRQRTESDPIPFRDWLESEYDPVKLQHEFDARRRKSG